MSIDYNITYDHEFLNEQNAITPELSGKMEYYFHLAKKGKRSSVQKLLDAIEKYPDNPQLKNYLSVLYGQLGDMQKAFETNRWILTEHPEYLFGKLNLANDYLLSKAYHKIPEILGEAMDLKSLYPHRETFHIKEVTSFLRTTILYFAAIGNLETAETRFEMLEELAPESEDTALALEHLTIARLGAGLERKKRE